jgi:hypothetical protein
MMGLIAWRRLVVEAAFAMLAARALLVLLPFSRLAGRWGVFTSPGLAPPGFVLDPVQAALARHIAGSIASAARHLPFESSCLVRAAAAHTMLRRRGVPHRLHLGAVSGQQQAAETHAWLSAGEVRVSGYPLPAGMVELGCFPWSCAASN